MMPREDSLLKLNTAIRACLDRCYRSGSPLVALASFVAELRQRPEWKQAEIDEVEFTVRRILQAVVTRGDDSRTKGRDLDAPCSSTGHSIGPR